MQLLTPADAARRVTAALQGAAEATGAGFDYLVRTASRESSLNASAQNPSSSARGLFQFIDSTWLEVLKEEGPKLGLAQAAADVTKTASGRYTVADPQRKAELLAMRDDPQASALLAGAFTKRNAQAFASAHGRAPTEGELYAAHFLGAQGAIELTTLAVASPNASAADAFPAQAAANRAIFFDKGRARSASEVYARLTATPAPAAADGAGAASFAQASAKSGRPASAAIALQSSAEETPAPYNGGRENDGATFHSLFKTGRRSPVAAYVQQAWSSFGSAGVAADTPAVAAQRTADAAMGYAPAAAQPRTSRAAEAAATVEAAAARRNYPAWPSQRAATAAFAAPPAAASRTVDASAAPALAASLAPQQPAEPAAPGVGGATAQAAAKAEPLAAAKRAKIELMSFLGVDLPVRGPGSTAMAAARGRP